MVETVLTMADIYFSVTQHGKKSGTEAEKKVTREKQLGKFENLCRDASLTEKGARTRIKTLREYALKMPVYVRRDARMEAGEDLWTMMVAYGVREAEKGYNEQNDAEDFWNDHCKQLGMVDWDLAARKADEACVGCKTHGRTCEYASYNSKQKGCRACLLRGDCCDMPRLSSDELEERDVVMSISAPVSSPHRHDSISQGIGTKRKRVEDAISPSKPRRPPPEHSSDDDDDMPMQVVSISPAKPPRKHTGKKKKEPALQAMDVDPSTSSTIIARTDTASKATPKLKALQPQPAKETLKLSAPPEIPPKKKRTKQPSVSIEIVGPAEESQYASVVKQITANSSKLLREEFDPDWLDGIRTLVNDLSTTCLERIREDYLDVWVGIVAIGIWEELNVDKWDPPKKWQIETSNLSICHAELSKWDAVPFVVPEEHRCKHCPPGKCQYISRSSSRYKGHKCRMCFLKNLPPCLPGAKPRNSVASALSSSIIADAARDEAQGSVVKSAKSKSDASASTTDVDVDMVSDSEKGDDGDENLDENGKEVDEESSEDYKRIQNVLQNAPASKLKDRKWLSSIQRRLLRLAVQEQELIRVEFTDVWVQIVLMDLGRAACSEDSEALQKMKLKGSRIRHVDLTQFDLHAQAVEEPCASCPEGGKCQYVDVSGILYKGRKCRMCSLMKRVCSLPKRQKQEESDMEVEDEEVVDVDVVMKSVRKSKNVNAKEKEKEHVRGKEKEKEQTKTKPSKPKRSRGVEESPLSISNWTSLSNPPPAPVEETPPPVDEDSAPASPTPQSPLFSSTSQSPQHVVTPTRQYTFPQSGQASPPSSWSRMLLDSPPRREMSPRAREEPETPYPRRLSNPPRPLQESPFTTKQLVDSPTRQVVDSPTRQESRGFPLPPSGPPPLTISCSLPTPSSSRDHSGSSSRQPSDSSSREASGSSSRRPSTHDHRGSSSHASGTSNAHEFPAPSYPHTHPIATSATEQAFPLPPPPPRLSWTKAGPSSGQSTEDLSKTERYFGRTHASPHDGHSPGSRHDPRSPVHRSPSHRSPSRRDGPSSVPHQQYDTDLSVRYHLEKEVKMKEVEIAQRDEALRVRDAEVERLRRELDTMKAAWARKEEELARAEKEKEQALSRVRFIESGMKVLLQPAQDIM